MIDGEIWKHYKGHYFLSNHGRWYSVKANKILTQAPNNKGYLRAALWFDGIRKQTFTHINVVALFGDKHGQQLDCKNGSLQELGISIDHCDTCKLNNKQSNLEIVPHKENCQRAAEFYRHQRLEKVVNE